MKRQRYVALLRGINLGNRRLRMDELRRAFEALGLENVATFIASGNVVFDHGRSGLAALESRLEAHLESALGFRTDTFVRGLDELADISRADGIDVARDDGFNIHVMFLRRPPASDIVRALGALEGPDDRFDVRGREVLWLRRGRLTDSPVKDRDLQKALGKAANTMRNLNTIEKIVAKYRRAGEV
ncbi:MAG: DUF1697 domain-containing protein [Longimicrobiales bacterium]